jgi:hypothetical protein
MLHTKKVVSELLPPAKNYCSHLKLQAIALRQEGREWCSYLVKCMTVCVIKLEADFWAKCCAFTKLRRNCFIRQITLSIKYTLAFSTGIQSRSCL